MLGIPPLTPNAFAKWKLDMESHIRSASTQLWVVILNGFNPEDPLSLTPREVVDDQLNASACHMLRKAVFLEYKDSIALLKTTKLICYTLQEMFEEDDNVQQSRLAILKQDINLFIKKDGETADQVFQILKSIVLDLRNFGCTWVNDSFIKDKFMGAMTLRIPAW